MSARNIAPKEIALSSIVTPTEQRELVQRIATSPHLNKSPRLTELLHYISERSINHHATIIHEQEIGAEVFGRPADYDTSQDNIVRVQVSQLRKKLEKYFETEGTDEPFVLEIPRGSYVPHFHAKTHRAAVSGDTDSGKPDDEPLLSPTANRSTKNWLTRGLLVACAFLVAACVWLLASNWHMRQPRAGSLTATPALKSLWSQLLVNGQHTDIVLADSTLSLFQDRLGRQLTLQEYLSRDYESKLLASLSGRERDELSNVILRRYTSIADVGLLTRILRFTEHQDTRPAIHFARDYQVRNLKSNNVVLLGSKRSTPWVELFEPQMNFRFAYRAADRHLTILNTAPQQNEQSVYEWPGEGKGYAVLAFLPNLEHTGSVLLMQGDDQISTEAAGEFVTTEENFQKFQQRIAPSGNRLPRFEVLLKTSKVGNATSAVEVVAHRLPKFQP